MKIQRKLLHQLKLWKDSPYRKPLILRGARQTGKTWLLKNFGKQEFKQVVYFNFDEEPDLKQFFLNTKDVHRIIQNLSFVSKKSIRPDTTLVIFDEIQECNDALNTLKYFAENAPQYAIACAGSLLGVALSRGLSFPVGKVDFLELSPLTFIEFLSAAEPILFEQVEEINKIEILPDIIYNQLVEKFKMFLISGGMPEAVVALLKNQDIDRTQQILRNILNAYQLDFSKHADNKTIPKINYIWESIPSQLARENKKFLYQTVKTGARARDYEDALIWLCNAGLVYRVFRSAKLGLPLSAYDDLSAFKLYMNDVGLLRRMAMLDPIAIREGNRLFTEFKGALSENFTLQSLITQFELTPRYWTSGNMAEVDFLIQYKNDLFPVEVKSDTNIIGKSLTIYQKHFQPILRIRFSLKNLHYFDGLLNIPIFLADYTTKFIELARK